MVRRRQVIEAHAPVKGIKSNAPANILDPRSNPDGRDQKLYFGCNQKEYGTSLYATGVTANIGSGSPVTFLFEAQFPNASVLQAFNSTGVYKYTSGSDGFVSDGQVFSGDVGDYFSGLMFDDSFLYSNGQNPIQRKSSVAATGTNMVSAVSPTTYTAWSLGALRDHLCLYHTLENGTEFFKRVRWSKKAPLVYSAGTTDFDSGTAGAIDLPDVEGAIRTAVPLGAGQAVYGDDSIHIQFWVGGAEVFRFQKMISGVGTPSRRGVASYKDVNYFISRDNFHSYHGGDDLRDIGDDVKKLAFSEINNSAIANSFVEIDPIEDEILFHVPTTGELTDTTWVYRLKDRGWTKRRRQNSAHGRFSRVTGLTIGELVGNIGNQNFTYGDAFIDAEAQIRLQGDQAGNVVKEDRTVYTVSESGTSRAQVFIYETPDLTGANAVDPTDREKVDFTTHDKRWEEFHVELVGNGTCEVFYSIDKGSTFTEFPESPLTVLPSGTTHQLCLSERSEQIRFRITNTQDNDYVGVKYYKVEFIPGSENR